MGEGVLGIIIYIADIITTGQGRIQKFVSEGHRFVSIVVSGVGMVSRGGKASPPLMMHPPNQWQIILLLQSATNLFYRKDFLVK